MRLNIYYGAEPRIMNANKHDFDRGNYECALVMRDQKNNPVIVSRSKDPDLPVWKVECGFSCCVFLSRAEAMAFCEKRYRRMKGGSS